MRNTRRTAIVTGASQGIGAGIVTALIERDFDVVATARNMSRSTAVEESDHVVRVDGDIADPATAEAVVEAARSRFGSIDVLVNNAGIFFSKPFTDYTRDEIRTLLATNVEGFLHLSQLVVSQMLARDESKGEASGARRGGSIVTITAALARNPIRDVPAAVPMLTKGGLDTITRHLAMEYAKDGIRVNAVAPGIVETPMHRDTPRAFMESLSPMGATSTLRDVAEAVLYLIDARMVTGQILYVDGGAHVGHW